jgi:hypothetical protein
MVECFKVVSGTESLYSSNAGRKSSPFLNSGGLQDSALVSNFKSYRSRNQGLKRGFKLCASRLLKGLKINSNVQKQALSRVVECKIPGRCSNAPNDWPSTDIFLRSGTSSFCFSFIALQQWHL